MSKDSRKFVVLINLENEHAKSFAEAFHRPGAILDAGQLKPESIPVLLERGIIAPAPDKPE